MPRLREVAPGVLVATSRFMTTNSVVIAHRHNALVIDPGVHDDELDQLSGELDQRGLHVVAGFATHAHWDHVLWHERLGDVPRWATPATVELCRRDHDDHLAEATAITPVDAALVSDLTPLADATVPWPGPTAQVVAHDAHQPGHAALHLPELGLLLCGDMTSDVEVPLLAHGAPGPDALARYHEGLDRLAALDDVDVVVTGHGHVCDVAEWRRRIEADRAYLDQLAQGRDRQDPRLTAEWLIDADIAMGQSLGKPAWRAWVRALPDPSVEAADAIRHGLQTFLAGRRGPTAVYDALPGEVDLTDLDLDDRVLPRIDGDEVTWHRVTGAVEPHPFGMLQPPADAPLVPPSELATVLVPGRLFDRHGTRVGRGGGHYDRLLPQLAPGIPAVGVTIEDRIVPRVPTDAHDAPMTHLATELGVRALG